MKDILFSFLNIFYYKNCYLCGKKGDWICNECSGKLEYLTNTGCEICSRPLISENISCCYCRDRKYSFNSNKSLFLYEGLAKELLYQYKFNQKHYLSEFLALIFAREISEYYQYFHFITPAPSSSSLFKSKNHMKLIAKILKIKYKLPIVFLLRSKYRKPQKSLDYRQRLHNLKGNIVFTASGKDITKKKILVIDDIFTTGATSEECSKILIERGAYEVQVLTIALD